MKELSAEEVSLMISGVIHGDPNRKINGINAIRFAEKNELTFLANHKYTSFLDTCKAGIVLVSNEYSGENKEDQTLIFCEKPDKAFSKLCAFFAPEPIHYESGIHPTAFVHPTAKVAPDVHVGPVAVIDEGAVIENGATICACAYIGQFCHIGEKTFIYPNVTIMKRCIIGKRCIFHGGVVIGGDGFGYTPSFKGLVKVPQNGIVQIDDDVEIGANTTVDRARFGKTWIKKGVKIDNLCQVGHNVVIGESSVLIAQSGIAGSTILGRGVTISAQAGINGHIEVQDGATVLGCSVVQKSISRGETVLGYPAASIREFAEKNAAHHKVKLLSERVCKLE